MGECGYGSRFISVMKSGGKTLPASLASLAADTDVELVAHPVARALIDEAFAARSVRGGRHPLLIDGYQESFEVRYPRAAATALTVLTVLPLTLGDWTDLLEQQDGGLRVAEFVARLVGWLSNHLEVLEQLVAAGLFEPRLMNEEEQRRLTFLTDVRRHYDFCESAEQRAGGDRMRMVAQHNGTGVDLWRNHSGARHMDESIRAIEDGRRVAS